MERDPFFLLYCGRVEPASWCAVHTIEDMPGKLAAGGFDVRLEAKRAVVAALARHELLGMSGAALSSSVKSAEAAFGRTVERMAESAYMQAVSAARAAGDGNPSRAAGVVIPWLLQNVALVRRAGTMAASRVLQLLRQGIPDDCHAALGPAFVYEVLGGPGGTALFEVFERPSRRNPTETVQWQCDIPAGTLIEGWPLGPDVWVHVQEPRAPPPPPPPSAVSTPPLCLHLPPPTIVGPSDAFLPREDHQPHTYVPLLHEGRQQLALVERAVTCLVVERDVGIPFLEGHDVFGGDSDPRSDGDGGSSDADGAVGWSDDDEDDAAIEQLALADLPGWSVEAAEATDERWNDDGYDDSGFDY